MVMSSSSGVRSGSLLVSTARYWMKRDVSVIGPPEVIGVKSVHDASGAAVLPPRTAMATLVPGGVVACHWIEFHATALAASKTRDRNVPVGAYGDRRIQSTNTVPPNGLKSLAATGRIGPGTATAWLATSAPST